MAIVVAALISPFMVLKPSLRQKTILQIRQRAREQGLQVQVMAEAIADQEGLNPTSIRYFVPWLAKDLAQAGSSSWLLVRDQGRGRVAQWQGWCWSGIEAPAHHQKAIDQVIAILPKGVNAVSVGGQGIGVYWQEPDRLDLIDEVEAKIKIIYQNIIEL